MATARRLRRDLSLPEMLLWRLLKQARGILRFRRQHAIGPYVADFYCAKARLVIEVDGSTHDYRQDEDRRRDEYLKGLGLYVARITASAVLADPQEIADSLLRLATDLAGPSTPQPDG